MPRSLWPALAENKLVERTLGIALPAWEEMQEIEITSRLILPTSSPRSTA